MSKITYRTILVIGDNHQEIAKKYSSDTKVAPHIFMKFDDAEKERKNHIRRPDDGIRSAVDASLHDKRQFESAVSDGTGRRKQAPYAVHQLRLLCKSLSDAPYADENRGGGSFGRLGRREKIRRA